MSTEEPVLPAAKVSTEVPVGSDRPPVPVQPADVSEALASERRPAADLAEDPREELAQRRERKLEEYARAVTDPNYADRLKAAAWNYAVGEDFALGDLVQWKTGLRNLDFPEYGRPAVFLGDIPDKLRGSPTLFPLGAEEELVDCYIGILDGDFDLRVFRAERSRFRTWTQ